MTGLEIILMVAALGLGTLWVVFAMTRQGHPEDDLDRDLPDHPGPTGEQYPTGSRPGGPGAERMAPDPSESRDGERLPE